MSKSKGKEATKKSDKTPAAKTAKEKKAEKIVKKNTRTHQDD
jgi:hypothetical protein